jgi:hypothetical protein
LRAPTLSIAAAKEFREILPYWVIALTTSLVWLVASPGGESGQGMAWALYLAGEVAVVAMGAASFGHEFTHRTLVLALSQPRARWEVWWGKMRVLGLAMACLLVVRLAGPVLHGNSQTIFGFAGLMSVSALAFGLLVAPLFALWSRSTLAGTVFTLALPMVTYQTANLVVHGLFGAGYQDSPAVLQLFVAATLTQWVVAPVLAYHAFQRLQATGERAAGIRLPAWLGRREGVTSGTRRRTTVWLGLTRKELRLLSPVYVVAGLYLLVVLFDVAQRRAAGAELGITVNRSGLMELATIVYAVIVSLLTGALACAEDRHAGTLSWHLVQPVAVWRQWLVKAGVALSVALGLAVGLPMVVLNAEVAGALAGVFAAQTALGYGLAAVHVLALCTLGLYISTLTGSTMRAILWAGPIGLTLETVVWGLLDSSQARSAVWNWFVPFETDGRSLASPGGAFWVVGWGVLAAGAFLVPLACACRNFRSQDQSAGRVARHAALVAGYVLLVAAAGLAFKRVIHAVGVTLPMRTQTLAERQAAACGVNLSEIANAVSTWALAHDHHVPANLAELTNLLSSPQVLVCPADQERQPAANWAEWSPRQVTYSYSPREIAPTPTWSAELRCPVHVTETILGRVLGRSGASSGGTNRFGLPDGVARQPGSGPDRRMLIRYGILPEGPRRERTNAAPAGR